MNNYPPLTESFRIDRLAPRAGRVRMVLDTDTYNEVDDQFAVAHAIGSPERVKVEALYAAPFHNDRSSGPGDGMEKSHAEIMRLLELMNTSEKPPVFRGATSYLDEQSPRKTEVTHDLIERAMRSGQDDPLYVVAIGAITNIASAILLEPKIIERIVVVWLGGHALHWPDTREFNLRQDIPAAQVIFNSGVPVVLLPCAGMADRLLVTNQELAACLAGRGKLADYLVKIVRDYNKDGRPIWSKVIWDIAATAWVIRPELIGSVLDHSPLLTSEGAWSRDTRRHLFRVATHLDRDRIMEEVFDKIAKL
jgi:inosine-uridine nucleoside N-ribohydrolase